MLSSSFLAPLELGVMVAREIYAGSFPALGGVKSTCNLRCVLLRHILGIQKGHHGPKLLSDLFDEVAPFSSPEGAEHWPARLVFQNPFAGKGSILNFSENFCHFFSYRIVNDTWAAGKIAVLGSLAH
jgi:hypothetical protein